MEQTLNDMKKDVLITVKGTQRVSGETDVTEMMTTGRFYRKNKLYYISYEETEATGSAMRRPRRPDTAAAAPP